MIRLIKGKAGVLGQTADCYIGHKLIFSKIIKNEAHERQIRQELYQLAKRKNIELK